MATVDEHWISLGEVIDLPPVQVGRPRVLSGAERLSTTKVKWVHVCEQADMADFVDPDNLVLTSGIGLVGDDEGWTRLIDTLGEKGASGVAVELHVTVDHLPAALVRRAERRGLAVIVFDQPTRFVEITHSVHRAITDQQLTELRRTAAVHEAFTRMTVEGANAQEIIELVAGFTNASVVLEDLNHRVLAFHTSQPAGEFLDSWAERERSADAAVVDDHRVVTMVGGGGVSWGRIVMQTAVQVSPFDEMIADRAAAAIAFAYSLRTGEKLQEQDAQLRLMNDLLSGSTADGHELGARLTAYGVDWPGRRLLTALVQPAEAASEHAEDVNDAAARSVVSEINDAIRAAGAQGICAQLSQGPLHVVVAFDPERSETQVMSAIAEQIRRHTPLPSGDRWLIAFGTVAGALRGVSQSFQDAAQSLAEAQTGPQRPYYRPSDLGVHGLLNLLQGDPRVQSFVERRLARLLVRPGQERERLLHTLRVYLDTGRSKSEAARQLGLSRPTLYARLERLAALLDADIEDSATALSLQVALAAQATRSDSALR